MKGLALACGFGALSGARSLLGPALVANRVLPPRVQPLLGVLAVGELIADKSAWIPARTEALPLIARMASGAFSAAVTADRQHRRRAAVAGAGAALAATYALYHVRRLATARLGSTVASGVAEDLLAIGAAVLMLDART